AFGRRLLAVDRALHRLRLLARRALGGGVGAGQLEQRLRLLVLGGFFRHRLERGGGAFGVFVVDEQLAEAEAEAAVAGVLREASAKGFFGGAALIRPKAG